MKPLPLVFQQTLDGDVVREAPYRLVTHFTSGDKYTTVHYGPGKELLILTPLKVLVELFTGLMYVHRSTLVKPQHIDHLLGGNHDCPHWAVLIDGTHLRVSRRYVSAICALLKSTEGEHCTVPKKIMRNPGHYNKGKRAREMDQSKDANPYARSSPASSWWLAGWNDTDIEVKNL